MKFPTFPLLPFSVLYAGITRTRNWLYDQQVFLSVKFPVPIINVGNLTVGGTGKTPHVEYLAGLLRDKKMAILSRGYKRESKGFILATPGATVQMLGDEPYQYHKAFPAITVAVSEDRALGITKLLDLPQPPEVIILDDALQHRKVQAHLNILLTDYHRPFYLDYVLPFGRLRESRKGAQRADIVVVSKTPEELDPLEQTRMREEIGKYTPAGVPVFFTCYSYKAPVNFGKSGNLQKDLILITGIAQPKSLLNHLTKEGFAIRKHFNFPDHHAYTQENVKQIYNFAMSEADKEFSILTTQKDWTKLSQPEFSTWLAHLPIFYVPIQVKFLNGQDLFKQLIYKTAVIAK